MFRYFKMSQRELEGNWEISVSSPSHLEVDPALMAENQKLTPRQPGDDDSGTSTISMDECWMINIKAPASLNVERGKPDDEGFQVRTNHFDFNCISDSQIKGNL